MPKTLCEKIRGHKRLRKAWDVVRENARTSKSVDVRAEVDKFAEDAESTLRSISSRLSAGTFEFGKAKGIPIPKKGASGSQSGKFRPIVLSSVEARVVQRAILDVLCEVPALSAYINTPHSFGGIKKSEKSIGAVPAALQTVLDAIEGGAKYVVYADIKSFFTRISKSTVSGIVAELVDDDEFMVIFKKAITVELENFAQLRERAKSFPIEDIGVAQGNSLSPLLGNIILHDFDQAMNSGDCRCIRYIDDFIILAPSVAAARAQHRKAVRLLSALGMELSIDKTSDRPISTADTFVFLGIELSNGLIRPSSDARGRFLEALQKEKSNGIKSFREVRAGKKPNRASGLISSLKKIDGIINGWGKHYRFCNDGTCFENIDERIDGIIIDLLQSYTAERAIIAPQKRRRLLGVQLLVDIERKPLIWRKKNIRSKNANS